jgi:hypothetical protein
MPSLNLKPNPYGGTAKEIMSSPYEKFEATQKKKIKQACVECPSWSFKKTEEKGLPGSNFI